MGRKPSQRKPPSPSAPAAGWRLLPPLSAAAADRAAEADALDTVVAALEAMRAEFVKAHGREPTEAEVIELVSLGLADDLDDDLIDDLLLEGAADLEDGDDDEDEPAP